ncbi:MAG: TIGR04283 family arsenosugar biosynthesis glycosyltransferase [Candidatus Saccharimonadales bacterium]
MISVIIPVYNEADRIHATIQRLRRSDESRLVTEIIVVDGGSSDDTVSVAESAGAKVVNCPDKGRAVQMNCGASYAKEKILYFLHADTFPPPNFSDYILDALKEGAYSGCFRLAFDYNHWFLKICSGFTKFDINAVRFGDQSLFVAGNAFQASGGFREDLLMMEDQEIIHRIKQYGRFKVMNAAVTTSARKYLDNGIFRMQAIFCCIWLLYYLGFSQKYLLKVHQKLIKNHKL